MRMKKAFEFDGRIVSKKELLAIEAKNLGGIC